MAEIPSSRALHGYQPATRTSIFPDSRLPTPYSRLPIPEDIVNFC
ncbi:hypothetical protein [Moorena bouillonii]|nr:hypothetical protein [Moorena bouillonii]